MPEQDQLDIEALADYDDAHRDHTHYKACAAHLDDLRRVYGLRPATRIARQTSCLYVTSPVTAMPYRVPLATIAGRR